MQLLKFIGLGIRDVYDRLTTMIGFTLLYWVCACTIVLGPPATIALFAMADPRRDSGSSELSDAFQIFRSYFTRAWGIWLCCIPLMIVLLWNTLYFAGSGEFLEIMIPLWVLMICITGILGLFALATSATMESGVRNAFRGAIYVLITRPFRSIGLVLLLTILCVLMTIAIIPMAFIGPAIVCATVNRYVLNGLHVEIIDPNAPTTERAVERQQGINLDKSFLERLRSGSRRR